MGMWNSGKGLEHGDGDVETWCGVANPAARNLGNYCGTGEIVPFVN